MNKISLTLILSLFSLVMLAQVQNIRGIVLDKNSQNPLIGANVFLPETSPILGNSTDLDGRFTIENVPLGRYTIKITYIGYQPVILNNMELTAGKELILNVELLENVQLEEVEVIGKKTEEGEALNEMSTVSARSFSVEETTRYAGSLNDVARMVQNFAGVQGADDSRNDIVIRGNSPLGVLYRLEDIDIPNPNHFALNGTTGGPVSILNNNVLANSDFMTGAFPSEYGNAMAGVFDLKLRSGNNQHHEFLGQIGFNGLELMAEGPINKEKYSSYLVDYRYSTLSLFKLMGLNFGTGSSVPEYQDAFFKVDFPNKKGKTEIWGLGGISNVSFLDSENKGDTSAFQSSGIDLRFASQIGVLSASNLYRFNDRAFLKTSLAIDATANQIQQDALDTITGMFEGSYGNNSVEGKQSLNFTFNFKRDARNLFKLGVYSSRKFFSLADSVFMNADSSLVNGQYYFLPERWFSLTDYNGASYFIQPFLQWQYRVNEFLTINSGLHSQYFTYNKTYAFEPRLGIKWEFNENNSISVAYGVHHQLPPQRLFFLKTQDAFGNSVTPNKDLGMLRSQHFVLGYNRRLGKHSRLKTEMYYQALDQIPVYYQPNSYSVLNYGANFSNQFPDTLVNEGEGTNYGVEFTLERFLNKGFYYLITTSIYESKYKGSDQVLRNTAFNGNYTFNALLGKEFFFNPNAEKEKNSSLVVDVKYTQNGGQRYIPIDLEASRNAGEVRYRYSQAFEPRHPDYIRLDFKVGFKLNKKKLTQEWSLNIQNLTNRKNIYAQNYDAVKGKINTVYQTGLLPIMQYKILF